MPHNKALKAVARKWHGVMYALMRNKVPYLMNRMHRVSAGSPSR